MIRSDILVTVEGVPLKEAVDAIEGAEIREAMSSQVAELNRLRPRNGGSLHYDSKVRGPAGPVKILTNDEIRKEKGVMAKPLSGRVENILWVIKNRGPVTVAEIGKEAGINRSSCSSIVSKMVKYLNREILVKHGEKPMRVELFTDLSVEDLARKYRKGETGAAKKKAALEAPIEPSHNENPLREKTPTPVKANVISLQKLVDTIRQLNVMVSGRVEVVFRFEVPK